MAMICDSLCAMPVPAPFPPHPDPSDRDPAPFKVEAATTADFLAIAALDRTAWRHAPHGDRIADGEHIWRIWCQEALTFVARAPNDLLAGAVVAFPCLNGSFCLHKAMVDFAFRGQGLGSLLFEGLLSELDRREITCFLTVAPNNQAAIRLYRKWGFCQEELVHGYYRPDEDRLVLTRPPAPSGRATA